MQGVFAEYEREKILERTRRGRKYSASKGNVSVFIQEEYRRRECDPKYEERKQKLTEEIATTQSRLDRLIDVYEEGALERGDFLTRTSRIRSRKDQLASELIQLQQSQHADQDYEAAGVTLASLSEQVRAGLETADWDLKRTLIQLLVKQIEVHAEEIRIVLKVPSNPFDLPPDKRGVLSNRTSRQTGRRAANVPLPFV